MGYNLEKYKNLSERDNTQIMLENIGCLLGSDVEFDSHSNKVSLAYEGYDSLKNTDEEFINYTPTDSIHARYSFFMNIHFELINHLSEIYSWFNKTGDSFTFDPQDIPTKDEVPFTQLIPFINYYGDSSGWVWTYHEMKNLKEYITKNNLLEKIWSTSGSPSSNITVGELFDEIIEQRGFLCLR